MLLVSLQKVWSFNMFNLLLFVQCVGVVVVVVVVIRYNLVVITVVSEQGAKIFGMSKCCIKDFIHFIISTSAIVVLFVVAANIIVCVFALDPGVITIIISIVGVYSKVMLLSPPTESSNTPKLWYWVVSRIIIQVISIPSLSIFLLTLLLTFL